MRKALLSMTPMALIGSPAAFAQGRSSTVPQKADKPTVQAPVGHRQPHAGDVSNEKNLSDPNNPLSKEDAEVDRKIRSICRGC